MSKPKLTKEEYLEELNKRCDAFYDSVKAIEEICNVKECVDPKEISEDFQAQILGKLMLFQQKLNKLVGAE